MISRTRPSRVLLPLIAFALACGSKPAEEGPTGGIHDRGLALAEMGRVVEAVAVLEASLAHDPSDFEAQRTYWRLRKKQDEGAIDALLRHESDHPDDPLYPRLLAELHPDPGERLEAARRAERLAPDDAAVAVAVGDAFYDLEMPDSAGAAYDRALELDPSAAEAYISRAALLEARGDRAAAAAMYRAGLEWVEAREGRDRLTRRLFSLLWNGGDFPAAVRLAQGSAEEIEDPWALNDMAWTLAEAEVELGLAERLAERAVGRMTAAWAGGGNAAIDPKWAERTAGRYRGYLLDTLGFVRLQAGRAAEAIAALEQGAELIPYVDSELLKKLSTAYRQADRLDDAIDALLTILSVSNDEEARERLEAFWIERSGGTEGLDEAVEARRRERMEPAADFRLATMAGDTLSLSSLRGQVVLLNFWFPT
jgi:tetratricopeptide (TPR) repeat protein